MNFRQILLAVTLLSLFLSAQALGQGHGEHAEADAALGPVAKARAVLADDPFPDGAGEATGGPIEAINALCPVTTDEPIEEGLFLDIDGERIGFCCKKCKRKYAADPGFFAEGLSEVRLVAKQIGDMTKAGHQDAETGRAAHTEKQAQENHGESSATGGADEEHDHATGHGESEQGLWARLLGLLGKLHPLVVHLPIGLGIFAAIAEGLFVLKGERAWRTTAIGAMLFAALFASVAAPLGWIAAGDADFPRSLASTLQWHRYAGFSVVAWLLVGAYSTRAACEGEGRLFRVMAFGAPVLIGWAGHLGGTLVFGAGYFSL